MIDLTATATITAPSAVDGFGEVAVLNDTASGSFVGYVHDFTTAIEVRKTKDSVPEGHGGIFGSFWYGERTFTLEVALDRAATFTLSNARADKLFAATDAMASDASFVWTDTGRVATRLLFRREEDPRGPDKEGHVLIAGSCQEALILANSTSSGSPGSGLTNAGKHATFPSITFTSGASGTVVLSRTSPSPTESLTLDIGGSTGLTASTVTTVDFAARTVVQGSTDKYAAVQFPTSVWWAMAPGANTISVTGGTSATITWRSAWLR